MTRRLSYLGAILALIMAAPATAQQADTFEAKKAEAIALFLHGKVNAAIRVQQDLIPAARSTFDNAVLRRDLMEMCATVQDWACVEGTIRTLIPIVQSDPQLDSFRADIKTYAAKRALWLQDDAELARVLGDKRLQAADALENPSAAAGLMFALHDYSVRKNDLKNAEKELSTAILATLLSDRVGSYRLAELSVGLLQALLHAQDIVGAMALANMLAPVMYRLADHDSVIAARYLLLWAHLSAYTDDHSGTAKAFQNAARAIEQLDIDDDSKTYDLAVANSLATAALVLDGRDTEAKELHARHALQPQKETILARGIFLTKQEFYFAVSDIFLAGVLGATPDARWKPLLENGVRWKLDAVQAADFDSYRDFALGLVKLKSSERPEGLRLLKLAARRRIDNVDAILRANFEGFPLPSLMDSIIIGTGLSAAARRGGEDIDLMLRGSEVLGRTVRHELADAAVLLGSQPNEDTRRSAQSYLHLLRQKRDWELDRLGKLLARDGPLRGKGALVREYQGMMATLADAKERLFRDKQLAPANGLPTLADLQKNIPAGNAFVTYFTSLDGLGKLCMERDRAMFAVAPSEPEFAKHARLLEFATTASYPPNPQLDAQFPVSSAIRMRQFYFGGLESCMRPGTIVTVALPRGLGTGIPFGALLSEPPPARAGGGYDLAKAHWLIRDLSFSRVVSAREYIATMPYLARAPAPQPYLGVGDPGLDQPRMARLASSAAFRASLPTPNGLADFAELPETAEELRSVGSLFGASAADVLTRENASEKSFRAKPLGNYDVIHFATHGLIKQDLPGLTESALVLTPGRGDEPADDGLLTASEISRLALNARLVVLSACNTAKYDIAQASLGVHDLQAAFTVAGTPTLLASLWPVESAAARDITVSFFKEWRSRETHGAADALARATRAYLVNADTAHQHPRFWAPFVVVGNGAMRGAAP